MMHNIAGRKLGRKSPHRRAMMANLASSLILHNRIETTLPKAKELRPLADKLVTLAKKKSLHAQRIAVSMIHDKKAVHKLFAELSDRFAVRNGGYTRILKLGWRHGDAAPMAAIEYIPSETHASAKEEGKAAKSAIKKSKAAAPKKTAAAHKTEKHAAPKTEIKEKKAPTKKRAPRTKKTEQ